MSSKVNAHLHVRRYDHTENPKPKYVCIELDKDINYQALKREMDEFFGITKEDKKVIKIRNKDGVLIPMTEILKGNDINNPFIIDISRIHHTIPLAKNNANLLQDAYLDAIRQKIASMESRINQAELLVPQLQWRRQAHMDDTVNTLSYRVSFLNRRVDELIPEEWKAKMPRKMS
ncbi:hypothetical protein Trydic_g8963 [Trypoxylus dichotomus]